MVYSIALMEVAFAASEYNGQQEYGLLIKPKSFAPPSTSSG
jgi:hypothetical protein